jgi:hypothetical protein
VRKARGTSSGQKEQLREEGKLAWEGAMAHEMGKRRGVGRLSDGADSEVSCHGNGCLLAQEA